jgi:hypothetical protein
MSTAAQSLGGLLDVDDLVDAIDGFLRATDEMADWRRLSESEYVDRVLAFASAPFDKHASELLDIYFELVLGTEVPSEDRGQGSKRMSRKLYAAQEQLIGWLEIVRAGRENAIQNLKNIVIEAGNNVIIRPAFVEQNGKLKAEYRFFPTKIEAAFGYGLLLILDDERGYSICRCKYSECLIFFLEKKSENGRPRTVYCSTPHLEAARKAETAVRMRKRRSQERRDASKTRRSR